MTALLLISFSGFLDTATPLPQAHAHNDYEHSRPLQDALANGFCSVEADIYLTAQGLLVAHDKKDLRPERTLEALYLKPLRKRVAENQGRVYRDGPKFWLLIDVKSNASETYRALHDLLEKYADILSTTRGNTHEAKAVTVVISGARDKAFMEKQAVRYAGYDGRPEDLDADTPVHLMPWISANWLLTIGWNGHGAISEKQRQKLRNYVSRAHAKGRLIRFWATPEKEVVWKELRASQVDLINTDRLPELREFLLRNK